MRRRRVLAGLLIAAATVAAGCVPQIDDGADNRDNPAITQFKVNGRDCIFVKVAYAGGLSCDWRN